MRIREQSFGYTDTRDGSLRLIVIDGDFEREFFDIADAFVEQGRGIMQAVREIDRNLL